MRDTNRHEYEFKCLGFPWQPLLPLYSASRPDESVCNVFKPQKGQNTQSNFVFVYGFVKRKETQN
jgi:hypothetical protein